MTRDEIMAVYDGSNGDATSALYRRLEALGPAGAIAVNILRALKTSGRAKVYGRRYRGAAYDTKDWTLSNLCNELTHHADALGIRWGWDIDAKQEMHKHVLYVDLPPGQVSFHTAQRHAGPDYTGEWDSAPNRAARWAAGLLDGTTPIPETAVGERGPELVTQPRYRCPVCGVNPGEACLFGTNLCQRGR